MSKSPSRTVNASPRGHMAVEERDFVDQLLIFCGKVNVGDQRILLGG
jgi:hypothetical protein